MRGIGEAFGRVLREFWEGFGSVFGKTNIFSFNCCSFGGSQGSAWLFFVFLLFFAAFLQFWLYFSAVLVVFCEGGLQIRSYWRAGVAVVVAVSVAVVVIVTVIMAVVVACWALAFLRSVIAWGERSERAKRASEALWYLSI